MIIWFFSQTLNISDNETEQSEEKTETSKQDKTSENEENSNEIDQEKNEDQTLETDENSMAYNIQMEKENNDKKSQKWQKKWDTCHCHRL